MTNDGTAESNYSVLMSVYAKETPSHFKTAMESIWNQTVKTDDFILVCDGYLTNELNAVVTEMKLQHPDELTVIQLEQCQGLGNALNIGIQHCRHELVARMDSDDISCPDRCQRQTEMFKKHPDYSIISGTVVEFDDKQSKTVMRRLPEYHADIVKFAKTRNPFNHPCVMYKKSAVENAGGYKDFFLLEDYYLWIRMLLNGAVGYNIPDCLLFMRSGEDLYRRRSGLKYAKSQRKLLRYMKKLHFITPLECDLYSLARTLLSLMPNQLRQCVFHLFFRKSNIERRYLD